MCACVCVWGGDVRLIHPSIHPYIHTYIHTFLTHLCFHYYPIMKKTCNYTTLYERNITHQFRGGGSGGGDIMEEEES